MAETFDYIIIGAGSAGSVLADRLSASGAHRILVLEAGGKDDWIWFHIPAGYLFAIGNPRADWMFRTEPASGLNGRSIAYPRGKVIGGCSAINAMIYMRGQAADYDRWRQMGLAGWGWDDVLPLFVQMEDHIAPPNAFHRTGGQWRVEHPRMRWEILDAFADAAAACGIPKTNDFNSGDNFGAGYFQVNQKGGVRFSAARGFLKPALKRPNLNLQTHAHVTGIGFDGKRARSVRYVQKGAAREAIAQAEIILTAGAINSPHLLELSGIGDGARLQALGLPVLHHAPGVGENLQDHLQLRTIFKVQNAPTMNALYASLWRRPLMALEYAAFRRGPLSMAPSQLGAFARSGPEQATPDLQFHIQPLSLDRFGEPLHAFPAITASVCNLRPESRGNVHATAPDPFQAPRIDPNYLAAQSDQRTAIAALRLTRSIMAAGPMARYRPEEYLPGPDRRDDAGLLEAARDIATTIFHPVGTARMGAAGDPMAVTDARLKVQGVDGLRVADASIMPFITSGNTNSPTMMIAEKAAQMILEDSRT